MSAEQEAMNDEDRLHVFVRPFLATGVRGSAGEDAYDWLIHAGKDVFAPYIEKVGVPGLIKGGRLPVIYFLNEDPEHRALAIPTPEAWEYHAYRHDTPGRGTHSYFVVPIRALVTVCPGLVKYYPGFFERFL